MHDYARLVSHCRHSIVSVRPDLEDAQQHQFNKDTYLKLWASSWNKALLNATRTPKRDTGEAGSDDLRALDRRSSLSYTPVRFVTCRLLR